MFHSDTQLSIDLFPSLTKASQRLWNMNPAGKTAFDLLKYQPYYSTCYFLLLKRLCLKGLMLWCSSIIPCDAASNKGWAAGRGWRTINTIHSIFPQVSLGSSPQTRGPFGSKSFTHQVSSGVSFPTSSRWRKAASYKEALSEVTSPWRSTIVNSASAPCGIVIQLAAVTSGF